MDQSTVLVKLPASELTSLHIFTYDINHKQTKRVGGSTETSPKAIINEIQLVQAHKTILWNETCILGTDTAIMLLAG
jgi:hypothetical protein